MGLRFPCERFVQTRHLRCPGTLLRRFDEEMVLRKPTARALVVTRWAPLDAGKYLLLAQFFVLKFLSLKVLRADIVTNKGKARSLFR